MRFLTLAAISLILAACDTSSSVEFKGDHSSSLPSLSPIGNIALIPPSSGGFAKGTTTNGATVSLSLGTNTNLVSGTTSQGYKVQFNVLSQ